MAAASDARELGEALIDCTRYDEMDDVKDLVLVQGADVNYADETQKTALHAASANGSLPLVEFLLANGARQTPNEAGNCPLHWAALNGHGDVAKLLIQHGADVEARNSTNDTPMSLARLGQHDGLGIFLADAILQVEKARKQQAAAASGTGTASAAASSASSTMADGDDEDEDGDAALVETEEELTGGGQVADELAPEQPSQASAPSQP